MMIQGDGFFVTRQGGEMLYTRAGQFTFDANGLLVNTSGQPVQGWTAKDGVVNAAGKPDDIRMPLGSTIPPKATTTVTLKGNLSSDDIPDANNPTNGRHAPRYHARHDPDQGVRRAGRHPHRHREVPPDPGRHRTAAPRTWTVDLTDDDGATPSARRRAGLHRRQARLDGHTARGQDG